MSLRRRGLGIHGPLQLRMTPLHLRTSPLQLRMTKVDRTPFNYFDFRTVFNLAFYLLSIFLFLNNLLFLKFEQWFYSALYGFI